MEYGSVNMFFSIHAQTIVAYLRGEVHVQSVRGVGCRRLAVAHRYGMKVEQKHTLVLCIATSTNL